MRSLLLIAGTDPVSGAGVTADAAVAADFGLHPAVCVTAVTAQNTSGLSALHPIPTDIVAAQIRAVLSDLDVVGIKIGLVPTPAAAQAIADALADIAVPVVLDPVLRNGQDDSPMGAGTMRLWGSATLATPNVPEAEALTAIVSRTREGAERAALALLETGVGEVLLKGGHADFGADLLSAPARWLPYRRPLPQRSVHGTGCHLSTAIAAGLADGSPSELAVEQARDYLGSLPVVTARGEAGIFAHVRQLP